MSDASLSVSSLNDGVGRRAVLGMITDSFENLADGVLVKCMMLYFLRFLARLCVVVLVVGS